MATMTQAFMAGEKFGRGEKPVKVSEWNRVVKRIVLSHSCRQKDDLSMSVPYDDHSVSLTIQPDNSVGSNCVTIATYKFLWYSKLYDSYIYAVLTHVYYLLVTSTVYVVVLQEQPAPSQQPAGLSIQAIIVVALLARFLTACIATSPVCISCMYNFAYSGINSILPR